MSSSLTSRSDGTNELGENAQHFSRLHDESVAAAAWISGGIETAVLEQLDRRSAAEVEVPPPPAHELVAPLLEPVELGGLGTALTVEVRFIEVDARPGDCPTHVHAVKDGVDDD